MRAFFIEILCDVVVGSLWHAFHVYKVIFLLLLLGKRYLYSAIYIKMSIWCCFCLILPCLLFPFCNRNRKLVTQYLSFCTPFVLSYHIKLSLSTSFLLYNLNIHICMRTRFPGQWFSFWMNYRKITKMKPI